RSPLWTAEREAGVRVRQAQQNGRRDPGLQAGAAGRFHERRPERAAVIGKERAVPQLDLDQLAADRRVVWLDAAREGELRAGPRRARAGIPHPSPRPSAKAGSPLSAATWITSEPNPTLGGNGAAWSPGTRCASRAAASLHCRGPTPRTGFPATTAIPSRCWR